MERARLPCRGSAFSTLLACASLSSREYTLLPEGYSIAEKKYKNRINRAIEERVMRRKQTFRDKRLAEKCVIAFKQGRHLHWLVDRIFLHKVHRYAHFGIVNAVSRMVWESCSFELIYKQELFAANKFLNSIFS